jgi:hypothetical protein
MKMKRGYEMMCLLTSLVTFPLVMPRKSFVPEAKPYSPVYRYHTMSDVGLQYVSIGRSQDGPCDRVSDDKGSANLQIEDGGKGKVTIQDIQNAVCGDDQDQKGGRKSQGFPNAYLNGPLPPLRESAEVRSPDCAEKHNVPK